MAFQVTLHQMIVFFLVLAVGFVAGKTRIIEKDYLPKFAKLITTIFLPVMIFAYTRNGSTREALIANWPIIVFALVFYAGITCVMYGVAKLLRLPHDRDRVFAFYFIFDNTRFAGFALQAETSTISTELRRAGHRCRKRSADGSATEWEQFL